MQPVTQPKFSSPDFINSVQLILSNQWFIKLLLGLQTMVSVGSLAKGHTRAPFDSSKMLGLDLVSLGGGGPVFLRRAQDE